MTPATFKHWLATMKMEGLVRSDVASYRLLGMSTSAGQRGKRSGFTGHTGVRTALACTALLHRMEGYE